jgi:hypothetical protein
LLNIYAGPYAKQKIREQGFNPEMFDTILGASGGPKWFVLAGLDRILVSEFFARSSQVINVIGTSAGAFRAACMCQTDSRAAIDRLAHFYSNTVYSKQPSPAEISDSAEDILAKMLGDSGIKEILTNSRYKAHFIVARSKGLVSSENSHLQMLGLARSALANIRSRTRLSRYYDRVTFGTQPLDIVDPYDLGNQFVPLAEDNLKPALLASGSIPIVMSGIVNIPGAGEGMYRDGGITDYHFDLQFSHQQKSGGLTLYPHFYSRPITGWFDKRLTYRKPHAASYDNVVMLVPSKAFVASLPYSKISDRNDFAKMTPEQRIPYWHTILSESDRLAEYFCDAVKSGRIVDEIEDLPFAVK